MTGHRDQNTRGSRTPLATATPNSRYPTFMAGGYGAGDPPDPIPNSEVKTRCADGTAGATRWESTAPPAYYQKRPLRSLHVIGAGVSRFTSFQGSAREDAKGRRTRVTPCRFLE